MAVFENLTLEANANETCGTSRLLLAKFVVFNYVFYNKNNDYFYYYSLLTMARGLFNKVYAVFNLKHLMIGNCL